jgi:two-component sensor histidine kinase
MEQLQERTADLTASLKERDVLLQEVHHRVKNNLQVISSLISMQIRKQDNSSPQVVLAECKRRVDAISLIHEKLYQSRDYSHVPFSDYARSLATSIVHATDATGSGIELDMQCENVSLPVDKAISCGLILNELITNALKHAFPEDGGGKLHIGLHNLDHGIIRLVVRDSGVGTRETDRAKAGSLGLQLVNILTEQLDGHLTTELAGGTCVTVEFPSGKQKE